MFPSSSRTQKQSQRSSWFRQALAQTRELFIDWTVMLWILSARKVRDRFLMQSGRHPQKSASIRPANFMNDCFKQLIYVVVFLLF